MLGLKNKLPHMVAALSLLTTPPPPESPTAPVKAPPTPAAKTTKVPTAPAITPESFLLNRAMTVEQVASSIGTNVDGFLRWNPPAPNGKLPAGTIISKPPSAQHGTPDDDHRVYQVPYVVRLADGMTLSGLAKTFKVPLEILMDENCPGGEAEARKLKVGTDISIPLFQNLGAEGFALEGLRFNDPTDCLRLATRLVRTYWGPSERRQHLAVAFQHLSPEQRKLTLGAIVESLNSLREIIIQEKGPHSASRAATVEGYAHALASAKSLNDIDNPFRLSPASLVAITKQREALRNRSATTSEAKLVTIIGSKGDHNGAFPIVDKAIDAAIKAGRVVNYFEVGKVSTAVEAIKSVTGHYGQGHELIFIAGHGSFDSRTDTGCVSFAFSSVLNGASPAARRDMQLTSQDEEPLKELARATKSGGSIVYLSCFSGSGVGESNNMVVATTRAASKEGKVITTSGAPCATTLKSISFKDGNAETVHISYSIGECVRISSATVAPQGEQHTR